MPQKIKNKIINETRQVGKSLIKNRFINSQTIPFKPSFISLEVEETCFFKCKQCNIWKDKRRPNRMNPEEMIEVLDKLRSWMGPFKISFSGGESFSNIYFTPILKHANSIGLTTHVNTNAFLINDSLAKRISNSGIDSISISIDGLKNEHNKNRGMKNAFQRAEKAIQRLNELKKNKGFFLSTTTVIMKNNIDDLEKIIEWGEKNNLDGMHFQPLWENFSIKKHDPHWYQKSDIWPEKNQAKTAINKLIKLRKTKPIIQNSNTQLHEYLKYYTNSPEKFGNSRPCYAGINNFSIDIVGDVRLCFFYESVGNILKDSPKKIWNNIRARKLRQRMSQCNRGCKILLCNESKNPPEQLLHLSKKSMKYVYKKY